MTDDPLGLTGDAHEVADRIRGIDRQLDDVENRIETVDAMGMRGGPFAGMAAIRSEQTLDGRHADLLAERARLVTQLKALVGDR